MPRVSAFSTEAIQEAVAYAKEFSASAAAEKFSVSVPTIYGWIKKVNGGGAPVRVAAVSNGVTDEAIETNGHDATNGALDEAEAIATKRTRLAINRSVDAIAALKQENASLRAENARLKTALAPMLAAALRHAAHAVEAN